jgi:gliding motility-associated lipoprotein GldD
MKKFIFSFFWFLLFSLFILGCKEKFVPKPRGYYRIGFPNKEYHPFKSSFPYGFEHPTYAKISIDSTGKTEPYWMDILISENKAKVHLSYKRIDNNLTELTEDSRELVYKHAIKASSIDERLFINHENNVFGTVFYIKGNVASPMQFFLTDSSTHFIRGSFYISEIPNYDSLLPVITFLESDIIHLIETFFWN